MPHLLRPPAVASRLAPCSLPRIADTSLPDFYSQCFADKISFAPTEFFLALLSLNGLDFDEFVYLKAFSERGWAKVLRILGLL